MNANQQSTPTSSYPVKTILRIVLVVTLGATVYSAVSSQLRTVPVDDTVHFVAVATIQPDSWMPAPSSTATEGNVVDLTYPQN